MLAQVASPLNLVLVIAAVLAGVVERSVKEALVIGLVLALNGVPGFIQERRADQAVAALREMLSPSARVRRGGTVTDIPADDVVPGDVVMVQAGDRVPADGRVLRQVNLETDESGLTGESVPVAKSTQPLTDTAGLPDRTCMAHMTSIVTRGRADLLITATGMDTEIGKVAGLLERTDTTRTSAMNTPARSSRYYYATGDCGPRSAQCSSCRPAPSTSPRHKAWSAPQT
ncbi:P-type E1-E2 ATPase [Amycolatopsis cihanbeyliensis]|uniref:P-type E1-E2 ATPase n=1 Tax=Amycolatopsis cihanbeyliensis TaxID=1128664 RepID=A0A542DQ16_AMYCI|nr:P-type E1-E2 ATPase [Amycolatopsis cihanbeyliensis]